MVHWQDQFQQSQQGGLFLPQSPQVPRKQQVSPSVCSLCQQPHGRENQNGNHRPSVDDAEGWKQYWANKSQSWRTEPEISWCRQHELSQRRLIPLEPEKGIYPFGGMQLNRADVEWLLATLENGRGPIDWSDESQRERQGLDLQGAQLEKADLHQLPLANLHGGLNFEQLLGGVEEKPDEFVICLRNANLSEAHLERATLRGAQLEGADLLGAQLEGANLTGAQLEGAYLHNAQLEGANLTGAHLEGATLLGAHLEGATLLGAHLEGANLFGAHLEGAYLHNAQLEGANLTGAQLKGAYLYNAQLKGASLLIARLEGADLLGAQLEGADLTHAKLEVVQLAGVKLTNDKGIGPSVADASWAGTNMSVVTWSDIVMLGDEYRARQRDNIGGKKDQATRLSEYRAAMRATHQLAVVLQDQGLIPDASRFAYRAKCLERTLLWYELRTVIWLDPNSTRRTVKSVRKGLTLFFSILISWLFSWFLFLIAGYGYRLRFCFFWYFLVILGCAFAYLLVEPHYFTWWTALGESVNVFHGRGASPNIPQLTHPARFAMLTIAEAWAGLVIEVVFVATLIQRFFGK